mgnify:FL=1
MVRKVGQKKRGKVSRKTKKIILVGAEGKNQTERKYFKAFNQVQSEYKIMAGKGNNTDPVGVVEDLLKSAKQEELDLKDGDMLACFIDVDFKKGRDQELRAAMKLARQNNISVFLSNPCFEIWYLLHFRYSTKLYGSNEEVIKELGSYISDYSKSKDVYDLIENKIDQALLNTKRLESYHLENGTNDRLKKLPSTEAYKLIEMILEKRH